MASDEYDKEDLRDFGLWKAVKNGEPAWDSPWGKGRPGWHIECSAMSMKYFGESFDIHCGGVDNMFPHHENEIAQSESATGKEFVHTWIHSEHLMVDGAKMSKSLGNQYTLKGLLERGLDPRAIRYLFISAHYRQKLNFTFDSVAAAGAALGRVDEMRFRLSSAKESGQPSAHVAAAIATLTEDFAAALADDLNASAAMAAVFGFVREVNKAIESSSVGVGDGRRITDALAGVDRVLGVLDPTEWQREETAAGGPSDDEIEALLAERQQARKDRDFATADRIRDQLQGMEIVIEDTPQGPRWRPGVRHQALPFASQLLSPTASYPRPGPAGRKTTPPPGWRSMATASSRATSPTTPASSTSSPWTARPSASSKSRPAVATVTAPPSSP